MSELKQVIIVDKSLGMSPGKIAAQVAHASVSVILEQMRVDMIDKTWVLPLSSDIFKWDEGSQVIIVLTVESQDDLVRVYHDAQNAGLPRHIFKDEGRTELTGPTYTAVAIGPAHPDKIDAITRDLPLL